MIPGVCNPSVRFAQTYRISLLLVFCTCVASAQTQSLTASDRIAQDREQIHIAQSQHSGDSRLGYLWGVLADDYRRAADFLQSEDAYNRSIQLLKSASGDKTNYATALDNMGNLYLIYARTDEAWICAKKALVIRKQLGNQFHIAMSLKHMADIDVARHRFKDAEKEATEAADTLLSSEAPPGLEAAALLQTLSYIHCKQNTCDQGIKDAEHAYAISRDISGPDSLQVGLALEALGFAQWRAGQTHTAETSMLRSIEILKNQTVPGDPLLFWCMSEYRDYLQAMHRKPEAKRLDAQLADLQRPCSSCSVSVYSLSNAMR